MQDYIPKTIEEITYGFEYCHCNQSHPKGHNNWMCGNCKRPILKKETQPSEYKLCPDFDMDCFEVPDCLLCHLYEPIGFCPFI